MIQLVDDILVVNLALLARFLKINALLIGALIAVVAFAWRNR